jgi:tetratricopeptide (TPR) repeat protein
LVLFIYKLKKADTHFKGEKSKSMKILKFLVCVVLLASSVGCLGMMFSKADKLAMSARYSELETHLEGQVQDQSNVGTKKLFLLCGVYSRLKEYNKLFPCLDQLQSNIDKGDRTANTFDISAEPAVLRAEAYIDLGNYAGAVAQATKAYEIVQQRNLSPWMRSQALSVLALSHALKGDRAQAEGYARLLGNMAAKGGFVLNTDILNGQARTYMALGDFQRSLAIIKQDEAGAGDRSFANSLVFGMTPGEYDVFAFNQLPKAFTLNKSLYETGQIQTAKAGYDKLLANTQTKDHGDIYWLILFDRGKIAEAEGNRQEAIGFYQRAIEVIERQRSTINTEASKIGFVGNKQQVYHA